MSYLYLHQIQGKLKGSAITQTNIFTTQGFMQWVGGVSIKHVHIVYRLMYSFSLLVSNIWSY